MIPLRIGDSPPESEYWEKENMEREIKCPDCAVTMIKGFVPDRSNHGAFQDRWISGDATFWSCGIHAIGIENGDLIDTFRCPTCGLLRSFAFLGQR